MLCHLFQYDKSNITDGCATERGKIKWYTLRTNLFSLYLACFVRLHDNNIFSYLAYSVSRFMLIPSSEYFTQANQNYQNLMNGYKSKGVLDRKPDMTKESSLLHSALLHKLKLLNLLLKTGRGKCTSLTPQR
jgi:hypothetical protein